MSSKMHVQVRVGKVLHHRRSQLRAPGFIGDGNDCRFLDWLDSELPTEGIDSRVQRARRGWTDGCNSAAFMSKLGLQHNLLEHIPTGHKCDLGVYPVLDQVLHRG